ncbi:MAG: hypothetical protein A4S09_05715 [Proteobacteria bacterium SG_bin7]|nr:MAG: hypothetical protein A4S09_05715 [Proteobacteria bacterium SG_bin7]
MRSLLSLLVFVASINSFAIDEGDVRFGLMGGNVSLLGDVGSGGQNSLGVGGIFGYQILNDIVFNVMYLSSDHKNINIKHTDLSVGVDYYTGGDGTVAHYVSGGAGMLSNNFTLTPNLDSSAMALYLGAGIDFQVGSNFLFGLKFKYNKAFDAKVGNIATVQDSVNVMAVAEFVLGKK